MVQVQLRYFASLREALGPGQRIELAEGSTLETLRNHLLGLGGRHAEVLARGRAVRCAVNQVMVNDEAVVLSNGAEVAYFPPVTGG
jgi:molybdopterin synthase sulfur carrier subunit